MNKNLIYELESMNKNRISLRHKDRHKQKHKIVIQA